MLVKIIHEDTAGLSEFYESLCREFDKLDKKILVIFEGIDRIYDKTTIQKLFAISEKISGKKLHVIFHYDMHVLKEQGFDRDYLKKYIPYTVNLTKIPYEKLVEYLWEDLKMSDTPLKMDDVCEICCGLSGLYRMNHLLGTDISLNINLSDCISIRKVRIFLSELKILLTSENITDRIGKEDAKTILLIVFIKHFFNPYYEKLYVGESHRKKNKIISVELVDNCNYCNLRYKNVYFQVIHFINELEAAGNMNHEKSYWNFFENYMGAAAMLGYLNHMEYWMFQFPDAAENNCEFAKSLLENAEKELEKKKEKQQPDSPE